MYTTALAEAPPARVVGGQASASTRGRANARPVASVMRAPVYTIEGDATVGAALCRMRRYGVHDLPVVDDDGALCGMLTYGDIRRHKTLHMLETNATAHDDTLHTCAVKEIMSRHPLAVELDTTLLDAGRLLVKHKVRALPVLDGTRAIVGLVTERDLFEAMQG
jgi:CBS domain-containing protein